MTATPSFILNLMAYSTFKGRIVGLEDPMCVGFANALRAASIEGRLRGVWTHPANELCFGHKTGVRAALSRAMGMIKGTPDYLFLKSSGALAMEAKAPKGRLTDNQNDFRAWCEAQGVPYRVFRSVEEGEAILREFEFLI